MLTAPICRLGPSVATESFRASLSVAITALAVEFFPKPADPHNEAVKSSVPAQETGVFVQVPKDRSTSFAAVLKNLSQQ